MRAFVSILLAVVFLSLPAHAQGAMTLLLQLNGTPSRVGVITAAGTSTSIAVTAGKPYVVVCDAAMNVGSQATCHGTITNANYCLPLASGTERYLIASSNVISAVGTGNCFVAEMR